MLGEVGREYEYFKVKKKKNVYPILEKEDTFSRYIY